MKKNILVLSAAFFTSAWLAACNSGNQPFPEPPAATEIKETETKGRNKQPNLKTQPNSQQAPGMAIPLPAPG